MSAVLAIVFACLVAVPCASAQALGDNPVPAISSLSPAAAVTGGPAFTLTVSGSGFVAGSQVYWNGEPRVTEFDSSALVHALIPAADIAADRTAAVVVCSPPPGGGCSRAASFVVGPPNPIPDVTGLSPAVAEAGNEAFSITVIGTGFVPGATVLWNGEDRTTGYINPFMLSATVRAADVTRAGTTFVSVINPAPGGGQSTRAGVFTVNNPRPAVDSLDPASVWAGKDACQLVVHGSGFTDASVVQAAGVDLPTTYLSSTRLQATVLGTAIAHSGALSVRVFTPGPGGGLSAAAFLSVDDDPYPPVTTVKGLAHTWNRTTVRLRLVATDVGLGVEKTFYKMDRASQYSSGTAVNVLAPGSHANDGLHVLSYYSVDRVLNWENPIKEAKVGIDTRSPTTAVAAVKIVRGGSFRPRFRVSDALSPRASDATLQISNKMGKVISRVPLGTPVTRVWCTGPLCTVKWPRGTYTMRVDAHDQAGNSQSIATPATLTIR